MTGPGAKNFKFYRFVLYSAHSHQNSLPCPLLPHPTPLKKNKTKKKEKKKQTKNKIKYNLENLFRQVRSWKFLILLVKLKAFRGVSFCDTEALWKGLAKLNCGFQLSVQKELVNFFQPGKKVNISNFIGFIFLKDKLVEPATFAKVTYPVTERL